MSSPLDLYEPLDIIGNGSFGIIRKVRRKSDGLVFARKELNFERMTERDRKQIVAEVNILKDLHHENIVRYHDRHINREAGILYILMEYCGGGDLSSVIKAAQRHNRPIPEDTVWSYFMQLLLALNHCHHPNGHSRGGGSGSDASEGKERRAQILHRDLKPDNVFLDENNTVKLGDFGLSKALAQASFANTYVGTPYYMSPELMQEKAYDSKSDIWSLGCLIYELCALKPPFHEAKTHAELSILIRNGRIPPLPKGYSPALSSVIKAMLNLNPAMRPSAAQLLQHERLEFALKVSETQKLLNTVKTHKASLQTKERELLARESVISEKESQFVSVLAQKDEEISSLRSVISTAETTMQARINEALARRDHDLRIMLVKQEQEVAARMAQRELEIQEAVRSREEELGKMWMQWEKETREVMSKAVEERMEWVQSQSEELDKERERLEAVKQELERKMRALEEAAAEKKGPKAKTPLEEVRNILAPLARLAERPDVTPAKPSHSHQPPVFRTPMSRLNSNCPPYPSDLAPPSAMKGVILTATGEPVATPTPGQLANLFVETPKVKLNFAKIFDFDSENEDDSEQEDGYETDTRVPSSKSEDLESTPTAKDPPVRPTRLRRPSIRTSSKRPPIEAAAPEPKRERSRAPASISSGPSSSSRTLSRTTSTNAAQAPEYDLSDEENLPSPFLKRQDRERLNRTASAPGSRPAPRKSGGNTLRTVAVMNAANAAGGSGNGGTVRGGTLGRGSVRTASSVGASAGGVRSSIIKAQRASEEAKRALVRA